MVITKEQIKDGLKQLGLKKGDCVIVHSALSSIGEVEGGADTVIDALLEVIGEEGTLMMPTMPAKWDEPFNPKTSHTSLGIIPDTLWQRPGVLRSYHPTHSVAVVGKLAEYFIKDHEKQPTAYGENTPYHRLAEKGGYILLLGVDQDRNTMLHTAEALADAPYLSTITARYVNEKNEIVTIQIEKMAGPHRNFIGLDCIFREKGIMKIGKIGNAVCRLIEAKKMIEIVVEEIKKNPSATLCDNPNCEDCLNQKGKIKEFRLKQEDFILTVLSDEFSLPLPELLRILPQEGIKHIELGIINGVNIIDLAQEKLDEVKKQLNDKGFKVSGLNVGLGRCEIHSDPQIEKEISVYKKTLDLVDFFQAKYIVIASFKMGTFEKQQYESKVLNILNKMVDLAKARNTILVLENVPGTYCDCSEFCEKIIRNVNSPFLRLAFNPANFVKMYQKPFLQVPPSVRNRAGVLYINDALFTGEPKLLGHGNAEIKELISILRCRSFNGFFSIRPGWKIMNREDFFRFTKSFWDLLDTM